MSQPSSPNWSPSSSNRVPGPRRTYFNGKLSSRSLVDEDIDVFRLRFISRIGTEEIQPGYAERAQLRLYGFKRRNDLCCLLVRIFITTK